MYLCALGTLTQQLPAYVKIQCLGGNRKSSSLLSAAVPCYTSLKHTLNQGCISLNQECISLLPKWSAEVPSLALSPLALLFPRQHFCDHIVWKVQGTQLIERKIILRKKKQADPVSWASWTESLLGWRGTRVGRAAELPPFKQLANRFTQELHHRAELRLPSYQFW